MEDDLINKEYFAASIRKTMQAITHIHGADCLDYAVLGVGLLQHLGVKARVVAGHASWRVGPGDGDVVTHDPSISPSSVYIPDGDASMFHAWIEMDKPDGLQMIDLTTFQLRDKAAALDAVDGGSTAVEFCPDFIWGELPNINLNTHLVTQSMDVGVYSYKRVPEIERVVFAKIEKAELRNAVATASFIYGKMIRKEAVRVIGIDTETGETQEYPANINQGIRQASRSRHSN